jgi:hypothetical protein
VVIGEASPYGPTPAAVPAVPRGAAPPDQPSPPSPVGATGAGEASPAAGADATVDFSSEARLRIEELELRVLEGDPFRLLEVGHDVDRRALRRAYFRLSKEFHPDRYFGRQLGSWRHRLQQVFAALTAAFEELSDETRRADAARRFKT